jgi:hypothetical protein
MTKVYYAAVDGYIEGAMRKKGDRIGTLTDLQAKYPLQYGQITEQRPEPPSAVPTPVADDEGGDPPAARKAR